MEFFFLFLLLFHLGKGSKKEKSGIFQIWSDPLPTLLITENLEKNKIFIVLK